MNDMIDLTTIKPPLSNVQHELLRIFSRDISEEDMEALKQHIGSFFLQRARDAADKVFIEKGYDASTIEKWLNED